MSTFLANTVHLLLHDGVPLLCVSSNDIKRCGLTHLIKPVSYFPVFGDMIICITQRAALVIMHVGIAHLSNGSLN